MGQDVGNAFFDRALFQCVEQHLAQPLSRVVRMDEICRFGSAGKGRDGVVGAQQAEADNVSMPVFQGAGRITMGYLQEPAKSLVREFMLRVCREGVLDVMVENIDDWFAIFIRYRGDRIFHVEHLLASCRCSHTNGASPGMAPLQCRRQQVHIAFPYLFRK